MHKLPRLSPVALLTFACAAALAQQGSVIEHEEKSAYSKIRVIKEKNVRSLCFVRESGEVIIESMMDIEKPHELLVPYTRLMFASYLFKPKQEKVLIVGLGGGSMIHFLKHYDPQVKVDVVEIDPAVVKIADKYFGVKSGDNVNIITKDAFEHLKNTDSRYDVIYMDAFLKPSADTDTSGVPLRLKTIQFYKDVQKKLTPTGMVAFNVHPHKQSQEDIKNIRDSFGSTYVFRIPNLAGFVVVGSMETKRAESPALRMVGEELDRRFKTSYSFRDMVERLAP
jgi:spermidine synthase